MQGQVIMQDFHLGVVYLRICFKMTLLINKQEKKIRGVLFCHVFSMQLLPGLLISVFGGSRKEFICVSKTPKVGSLRLVSFLLFSMVFCVCFFVFTLLPIQVVALRLGSGIAQNYYSLWVFFCCFVYENVYYNISGNFFVFQENVITVTLV